MKIGLIQIGANEEKEKSLALAEEYITNAAKSGADIIMLPEMFNCPYNTKNFPVYAEPEGGPSWKRMSEAARTCGKYLIAGSMPERKSVQYFVRFWPRWQTAVKTQKDAPI